MIEILSVVYLKSEDRFIGIKKDMDGDIVNINFWHGSDEPDLYTENVQEENTLLTLFCKTLVYELKADKNFTVFNTDLEAVNYAINVWMAMEQNGLIITK